MKVAVTGANGHLGASVVRALLHAGHDVIAIVRRTSDCTSLENLDVEVRFADVTIVKDIEKAIDGASHAINLAAVVGINSNNFSQVSRTNIEGPRNVATACMKSRVSRLVHVSSIHAFDSGPAHAMLDETAERPGISAFFYDRSKYAGELVVQERIADGLDALILNPTGIIGPLDHGTSYSGKLLRQLFEGRLPALVGGGFDWVDVRDVARTCVAALTRGRSGENYILSGQFAALEELGRVCSTISGKPAPRTLPIWLAEIGLPFLAAWARFTGSPPLYTRQSLMILKQANRNVSSAKAETELGFSARPLHQSLEDCHDWYGSA